MKFGNWLELNQAVRPVFRVLAVAVGLFEACICIKGGMFLHPPHGRAPDLMVQIAGGVGAYYCFAFAFHWPLPRIAALCLLLVVFGLTLPIGDRPLSPAISLLYLPTYFLAGEAYPESHRQMKAPEASGQPMS